MRGSTASLAEGVIAPPANLHAICLNLLDLMYASVILAPIVVTYWRGSWNLMDRFLFPGERFASPAASLCIGLCSHLLFTIFQGNLRKALHPDRHRLVYLFFSRVYTYVYGLGCVNGWRGGWQLLDNYTPMNIPVVMVMTLSAAVMLTGFKTLRNISASPFFIATDHSKEYFAIPTMFKTSGSREPGLYVLDCIFSVVVIGSLVVFVWRGLWVLLDLTLYAEDKFLSLYGSLTIGYGVVGVTFALQPMMRWACNRLEGLPRLIVADVFLFFSFIGTVNVWRGIWMFWDLYFLPDQKILSDVITHAGGFIILALLNCSNSVLVRGVYIDAEEPAGQCVVFPVYYIRLFFQKERSRKQRRLIDALEKIEQNNTMLLLEKPDKKPAVIVKSTNTAKVRLSDAKIEYNDEKTKNGGHDEGMMQF